MDYVNIQASSSIILLITGMVLGGFLDLYRVFRATIKVNKWVDSFGDMLFWVLAVIVMTPLIYWSTWLELRLYVWLFLIIGLVMYYLIFSPVMLPLFLKFWHLITWLPRQIYHSFFWLSIAWRKNFWWIMKTNRSKKGEDKV